MENLNRIELMLLRAKAQKYDTIEGLIRTPVEADCSNSNEMTNASLERFEMIASIVIGVGTIEQSLKIRNLISI